MKLRPFKELIAMSKEKLDAEILTLESEVAESCTGKEINFAALIQKLDKIAILERRKNQYDKVLSELFPE